MGVTLTDVLLFGKAQSDDVDNATLVIYRRNILRWSALGGYLDVIVKGVSPLVLPDAIANSLSYVKAFGGTEQRDIPDNYLQRQFIYMMDGSYIKVENLPISAGYKVEFDFQTTTNSSLLRNYLGGRAAGVAAGGGFRLSKLASGNDNRVVLYGFDAGNEYYDPTTQFANNTRYKYTYDNGVCTLESGGSVVSTQTFTVTDNTSTNWGINSYANGTSFTTDSDGIYVYSLKVWNDQGELVMDLVPAVQKGTVPVVGFYDTVSGTFKTATAGTFAAGGEAVPTPDAPMNIVSNNGIIKFSPNEANYIADNIVLGYWLRNSDGQPEATDTNFYTDMMPVKPNVSYVCFGRNKQTNTISGYNRIAWYDANGVWIRNSTYTQNQPGIDVAPNNAAFARFHCNINGATVTQELVDSYNWVFQQGTAEVPYTPYSPTGIYTDGTVETINMHGKNLFDVNTMLVENKVIRAGLVSADNPLGSEISNDSWNCTDYISVLPNTTYAYTIPRSTYAAAAGLVFYSDKSVDGAISGIPQTASLTGTFTTPQNCRYVRFSWVRGDSNDVQLEQGSTATDYVPYYDGGTATAEMLLKVGNYQDVQSILDGVVTRSVGVKVLDGTENWSRGSNTDASGNRVFYLDFLDKKTGSSLPMLSTHFSYKSSASYITLVSGAFLSSASNTTVYFDGNGITTVSDWKQWLTDQYNAGTPVIVIYPLATPTTESVAGQTLQVTDGDNTLEITQASLSGLELEAKYQAAVSLTIQEVQDANLDPNVEVTIN